jgi:8-oxo-dGTP diphosphatase
MTEHNFNTLPKDAERAALAVDIIVTCIKDDIIYLLCIQRKNGSWALPGGLINKDEETEDAARRELLEETLIAAPNLKLVNVRSEVNRDPRQRTISFVYECKVKNFKSRAGDDAIDLKWFPIHHRPKLAFDHDIIVNDY